MSKEPDKQIDLAMSEPHPDHPGLTRGDVQAAKDRAKKKIEAKRKQEAIDRIVEQEEINLRDAMGETDAARRETENLSPINREMVTITLALAPQMPELRLDGRIYRDRGTYTVTRAKAAEMLYQQHKGWQHESVRKGDDTYAFYAQMRQKTQAPVVFSAKMGAVVSGAAPKGTH